MADVNNVDGDDDGGNGGHDGQPAPIMPHKEYTPQKLDIMHPTLTVPDDDDHDYEEEGEDPMLKEGNRVAKVIAEDAREHGRRKKAGGDTSTTGKCEESNNGCMAVLLGGHTSECGVHGDSAERHRLRHVSSRMHGPSAERQHKQQRIQKRPSKSEPESSMAGTSATEACSANSPAGVSNSLSACHLNSVAGVMNSNAISGNNACDCISGGMGADVTMAEPSGDDVHGRSSRSSDGCRGNGSGSSSSSSSSSSRCSSSSSRGASTN